MGRRKHVRRLTARSEQLPDQERGRLMLVLWGNAVATILLQLPWMILALRALQRVVRRRDYRPAAMLHEARSPALLALTVGVVLHRVAIKLLMRVWDRRTAVADDEDVS